MMALKWMGTIYVRTCQTIHFNMCNTWYVSSDKISLFFFLIFILKQNAFINIMKVPVFSVL